MSRLGAVVVRRRTLIRFGHDIGPKLAMAGVGGSRAIARNSDRDNRLVHPAHNQSAKPTHRQARLKD